MGIEFGDIKEAQPEPELRPDQNAQYATRTVGEIGGHELPIFVDLDVMRDMEAHAISNTSVELGGVMLGKQQIDDQGKPFVLVTESLRAEHYFATKGSFTFTHDTWSEITRRRSEFHPGLQMVGWYHTHPGWNVFLSGMDLFICDNFFNRPLDVALVIDPVNDDRGWFQWTDFLGQQPERNTQRTGGFVLTASRHRAAELEHFGNLYEKSNMSNDPRYSGQAGNQTIHLVDSKNNNDWIMLGMLALQMVFMAVVAYWIINASSGDDQQVAAEFKRQQRQTIRQQAQQELLAVIVAEKTGSSDLASEFTQLKEQEFLLRKNLEGQLAIAAEAESELLETKEELSSVAAIKKRQSADLNRLKGQLSTAETRLKTLAQETETDGQATTVSGWFWWTLGAIGMISVGGVGGYLWRASETPARRRIAQSDPPAFQPTFDPESENDSDQQDPVVPTQIG